MVAEDADLRSPHLICHQDRARLSVLVGYASVSQLQVSAHVGTNAETASSDEQNWCDLGSGLGTDDSNITESLWGHFWEVMNLTIRATSIHLSHSRSGDPGILSVLHAFDSLDSLGSLRLGSTSSFGSPLPSTIRAAWDKDRTEPGRERNM